MKSRPAEIVVEYMGFTNSYNGLARLEQLDRRTWSRLLRWLDDSGLAFYFLRKVEEANALEGLPRWVAERLQGKLHSNQQRTNDLWRRFSLINEAFAGSGISYAALKGFSLCPQFCPSARLRYQGDFDYLLEEPSLPKAQRCLLDLGYLQKHHRSSVESIFMSRSTREVTRNDDHYSAEAPHAVELHLDIWDAQAHKLPQLPRLFSAQRTVLHHWNGLAFPALDDEDAFLLQALHACQHLFTEWIRMSSFFEIAYFLNQTVSNTGFWNSIEERVGDNEVLREFVVIVAEMAAKLFAAPIPALIRTWGERIREGPRVWIDNYARYWAFSEVPVYQFTFVPRSRLALFLRQQYSSCAPVDQRVANSRPWSLLGLSRIANSLMRNPSLLFSRRWRQRQRLVRRSVYHALAGMRYLCEIPRWRRLNRSAVKPAHLQTALADRVR